MMSIYTKAYLIEIDMPNVEDMENLLIQLEYFNGRRQYVLPHYKTNDDKQLALFPEEKKATFLYVEQQANERDKAELYDLFGRDLKLIPIAINDISKYRMSLISSAKRLLVNNNYRGDGVLRWTNKSSEEVCDEIKEMVGFTDFKNGISKLCQYIDNAQSLSRANYNIVIVKNCEIDEDLFIEHIYNLYISFGVIVDPIWVEGDLEDSNSTERNTGFLYKICENWSDNISPWMTITNQQRIFHKLAKRKTIFVTSMDKVQYEKMRDNDAFIALFPHVIYVNDITKSEKIEFIKRELLGYGFLLDTTDFESCYLLEYSIEKIKAQISMFAKERLCMDKFDHLLCIKDFNKKVKKTNKKSGFTELEMLVGLDGVKSTIREIATFLKNRGKDGLPCLHMVFRGNPGTGKTTVARIIGKIFAEIGILKDADRFVEAERVKLVSQYLGCTAKQTSDVIKSAIGGILFIDEAYSLCNGEKYDYGVEAVNTLVKQMEDYRKDFVCIMAGYTKEMDEMLNMNPGLKERVQFYIDFPDYTKDELTEIFINMCKDNKYKLSDSSKSLICEYFGKIIATKDKNFANGRIARKVFERIKLKQALRTKGNRITDSDIIAAFSDKDFGEMIRDKNSKKIGF